ncbi:MAG: CHAT domain-containing protein [Bacteroidales bacterium]|nr:CHAT domain-containing protein [Bacteroidales bacterium]
MNMVKIQFKALIFKSCPLLLILIFLVFPTIKAQSLADTNDVKNLYANSRVLHSSGDFDNAIKDLNKILLLKNKMHVDTEPEYFKVYNRLGLVYSEQGNLQKAIEYYRYALENTTDGYNITLINDNIANIYSFTGDYAKAINYFENSLTILEKSDKKRKYFDIVNNYNNQGLAYLNSGQMKLALEKCLKSLQIAEENQINVDGNKYYNCGLVYQALDSLSKADYCFKEAINTYIRNYNKNHYMTAMAYINHALFYAEIEELNKSEQLYLKAYKIFINSLGKQHLYTSYCLLNMGELYTKKGNYKEALNYYQKSLASKINNFNDSSIYVNPSTNVFPDLDLLDVLKGKAQALEMLAIQENKESNLKAALSTLEITVGFIEQLRMGYLYENSKLVLAEKEYETYMSIIKIAYELLNITGNKDYINLAFKYSERSKYAILRESINEESARNFASIPENIQKQEKEIKEQIGNTRIQIANENKLVNPDSSKQIKLKEKLFRLTQSREKIIGEFERNYPKYYKRKYENKVVEIGELQQNLLDKEAVISYEITDSMLYTFIVTKDDYKLTGAKIDSSFYSSLNTYIECLHSDYFYNYDNFMRSSYDLYKMLIQPFTPIIKGKNLLIIPNNDLSLMSFESLRFKPYDENNDYDDPSKSYLIQNFPIGYAYSASLYVDSKQKKKKWNPRFLGFAPDYKNSRDQFRYLPTVKKNLRKISWITLGKIFTKEKATEYNLKKYAKDYGIIHLYAYGNENKENPRLSRMYLSYRDDTIEDGYLHAYEVDELELNSELIVLASCHSGSGSISKGEGVLSIGRKFMNSGNQSIVMSLWFAYYKQSLFELKEFYKYLVMGKRKDEAMRLAKLNYLESTDLWGTDPKYWASLVVYGNQEPIYKGFIARKIAGISIIILLLLATAFLFWKKFIPKRYKNVVFKIKFKV